MFLSDSLWILVMNSTMNYETFLDNIYLPLHSQVFIIHGKQVLEVYRIAQDYPLEITQVGDWNSQSDHFMKNIDHLWQRRSNLKGVKLRITTLEVRKTIITEGRSFHCLGLHDYCKVVADAECL